MHNPSDAFNAFLEVNDIQDLRNDPSPDVDAVHVSHLSHETANLAAKQSDPASRSIPQNLSGATWNIGFDAKKPSGTSYIAWNKCFLVEKGWLRAEDAAWYIMMYETSYSFFELESR